MLRTFAVVLSAVAFCTAASTTDVSEAHAIQEAMLLINSGSNSMNQMVLVGVEEEKVETQTDGTEIYKLKLKAGLSSCRKTNDMKPTSECTLMADSTPQIYEATIKHHPLANGNTELWEPVDFNVLGTEEVKNMPGGITPADTNDESVTGALHFAVTQHNTNTNREQLSEKDLEITRVDKQVVAGVKYIITVRDNHSGRVYDIQVEEQAWVADSPYSLVSFEAKVSGSPPKSGANQAQKGYGSDGKGLEMDSNAATETEEKKNGGSSFWNSMGIFFGVVLAGGLLVSFAATRFKERLRQQEMSRRRYDLLNNEDDDEFSESYESDDDM
ncbi:hypothetical protein SARC_04378 [Sphaeroforma arctica JP610]|uniref:Cystatin domain-containing protein n=1 Tax=Sphaeroforma arctica JP610 TaxID=667725 RepID=A0A0L0G2R2_9EUKA|nr:hypothetical protein SARC_04378 [Sphaeroforma arctica JP610]KNC83370.1 hypothetical protein SARC_04378 [Sphaeroforma arctica JP610]|eukprot:XP_014157272.1 hypothetical protein SARC_04378 [Sphaeroforma arctica JP610]